MSMRAQRNKIVSWTATQSVLRCLGDSIAEMTPDEMKDTLSMIIGEIEALQAGDASAVIWYQAVRGATTRFAYGLQRLGLYPDLGE